MRNSFSLSVCFAQVLKSDVFRFNKSVFKFMSSFKMKLILLTAFLLKYGNYVGAGEQYGFPPQFRNPNAGVYASDSSVYLPPEAHTPVPYFPVKNNQQNLPFPYLPPTGTKAPSMYPSPFPVILSSTLIPIFDDDDEKEPEEINKVRISSPLPPRQQIKSNGTDKIPYAQTAMRREMRLPPNMPNYHNPIDRIDLRPPVRDFPLGLTTQTPINHSPKNMIISVDTHRNDRGIDQIRAPSAQNPHYVPAPTFGLISTTEPAIPILRLSNEMDLDGSFSYEALGADQTHYVQHSHMENMGTEKEEQVVEGSYSYVGDNGQTYTVHYIADSNGYRATGEHLPVAPPMPEIIQRAVQYNLAEEAKKPPHLRSWQEQNEEKEYESLQKHLHQYTAPVPPPPRSLFTGRTPEAFSYNFGQGSTNDNNLAAASSQVPVKTSNEIKSNGPISPQVTFLASQGAHMPTVNNNAQQSISRMFSTEKSTMPQLINYDAGNKEHEQDPNKGLWRWQYGLNPNNDNQSPEKNTISRSSGGGDDIMINFNDMTPDQYTQMLKSQLEPSNNSSYLSNNNQPNPNPNQNQHDHFKMYDYNTNINNNHYPTNIENNQPSVSTQSPTTLSYTTSLPNNSLKKETTILSNNPASNISPKSFNFQTQSVTDNMYDLDFYESKRVRPIHIDSTTKSTANNMNSLLNSNSDQKVSYNNIWSNAKDLQIHLQNEPKSITQVPPFANTMTIPRFSEVYEHKAEFKPIVSPKEDQTTTSTSTTTTAAPDTTTEDLFKTNIFLKSFITPKKTENKHINKIEEPKKVSYNKVTAETKADVIPKFVPYQPKPNNEIKSMKEKLSMDLMNYINMKNYFESNKVKPKNTYGYNNYDNRKEMRYPPVQYEASDEEEEEYAAPPNKNNLRGVDQEELRGIIKNYKVLHRNNHARHADMNSYQNRREVNSPSLKIPQSAGLPPLGRAGPSMKTYLPPTYL